MASTDAPPIVGHTAAEVLSKDIRDPDWIVDHLLAQGCVTTLGGYIGAGKTPLLLRMCAAIAGGRPFLRFPTRRDNGLRIAYLTEEPEQSFAVAMRDAGITSTMPFEVFYWDENATIKWGDMVTAVEERATLLVVDTAFWWAQLHGIGAENDPAAIQEVYRPLVRAAGHGLAVVATAHTVKGFDNYPEDEASIAAVRGSGAVVASSSVVALYKKLRGSPPGSKDRLLRIGRSRFRMPAGGPDVYVSLEIEGHLSASNGFEVAMRHAQAEEDALCTLIEKNPELTRDEIRERAGTDTRHTDRVLRALVETERVGRSGRGVKGDPYRYLLNGHIPVS